MAPLFLELTMEIAQVFLDYVAKANEYNLTQNRLLSNLRQQPVIWKQNSTTYKCLATLYQIDSQGIPTSILDNPVILPLAYEEPKPDANA